MRLRTLVVLLIVAAASYWIYKTHPTVSGFVDDLTRPLMGNKAVVKEFEHKRILSEALPAEGEEVAAPAAALKEGMKTTEVKELLGPPDRVEPFKEKGRDRVRWTYVRARRVLVFEEGRVVSIAIR